MRGIAGGTIKFALLVVDSLLLCKELDAFLPAFLADNLPEQGLCAWHHLVQCLDQARRL